MDESPLSDQQQMQANLVTQAYLQDTAREQQRKLEKLEAMYAVAHHGMVSFLTLLDPDFIDTCLKQGQTISKLDDRVVQQRVIAAIKELKEKLSISRDLSQPDRGESSEDIKQLKEENQQLRFELDQVKRAIIAMKQENESLRSQAAVTLQVVQKVRVEEEEALKPVGQVISPIDQGVPEPDWMAAWRQSKTFARDSVFLCLIGETGLSRQPSIKKLAALKLDLRLDNGSLSKPIERLSEREGPQLLESIADFEKSGSDAGGALPKFYRLTDLGRQAYWMLTGKNAAECEYDRLIKLHKTPEHTFLNLRAMDILEEIGNYSIALESPEIKLPDGSQFIPDMVARKNETGQLIYVEVERGTGKDTGYRMQKWINLCVASSGQIYVVCDTKKGAKTLTSEINSALAGYTYHSHLTDLEELQAKKRGKDDSIWIYQR
jgi:hypothetical protein